MKKLIFSFCLAVVAATLVAAPLSAGPPGPPEQSRVCEFLIDLSLPAVVVNFFQCNP